MRVLAVADADSYLKWSAATLDRLPAGWQRSQLLLATAITPSPGQVVAATGQPQPLVSLAALRRRLRRDPPDVLLLACTGPTVASLSGLRALRGSRRPVLVTGLPGVSVPASFRALDLRRGCDLFVVHSRRERADFSRLAAERAPLLQVALSRLPFLASAAGPASAVGERGTDVVFAAQAKVPPRRADREAILLALADVAPIGTAVVKLRATTGEQQTHHEEHPYPALWSDLLAAGRVHDGAVRWTAGSMRDALATARALVTVSSTAALEAIDADVPVVVLTDFGLDAAMINLVFQGSGLLGDLSDVRAGRAFRAEQAWLVDNYFHPPDDDDLVPAIESLLRRRAAGQLRSPERPGGTRRPVRDRARLVLPRPLVTGLRSLRRRLSGPRD